MNVQVWLYSSGEDNEVQRAQLVGPQGSFLEVQLEEEPLVSSEPLQREETPSDSNSEDLSGTAEEPELKHNPFGQESQVEQDLVEGELHQQEKTRRLEDQVKTLDQQLRQSRMDLDQVRADGRRDLLAMQVRVETEKAASAASLEEVRRLNEHVKHERESSNHMWKLNCEQLIMLDEENGKCVRENCEKGQEIERLRAQVRELEGKLAQFECSAHVRPSRVYLPTPVMGAPNRPTSSRSALLQTQSVMPGLENSLPDLGHPPRVDRRISFSSNTVTTPIIRARGQSDSHSSSNTVVTPNIRAQGQSDNPVMVGTGSSTTPATRARAESAKRSGKAPPIDQFTGEQLDCRFEDWLPTLERGADWNRWSSEEKLMQLAGHLRGKALQEWNLMSASDKATFQSATSELSKRLDPGGRVLSVQDFRHSVQRDSESVADFLRRLERNFQLAYGRDDLKPETRETMLYSQLHEGLLLSLLKSPSVSGSQSYKELCVAAKQEEKRLADIQRRERYRQKASSSKSAHTEPKKKTPEDSSKPLTDRRRSYSRPRLTCHNCGSPDHFARDCKVPSKESTGNSNQNRSTGTQGRSTSSNTGGKKKLGLVHTESLKQSEECSTPDGQEDNPLSYLQSSDDSDVDPQCKVVRVPFEGSRPRSVLVEVQGVPAVGIVDTGADISIMGADLFKTIAAATKMKKRHLKPVDKAAFTYDNRPIKLNGKLELDIVFGGKTVTTPIYLKMDAGDQLLLSEGICSHLGIVSYHPSVMSKKRGTPPAKQPVRVPIVHVRLVESVSVPPLRSVPVQVRLDGSGCIEGPFLVEPMVDACDTQLPVQVHGSLLNVNPSKPFQILIQNPTGFTQRIESDTEVGLAAEASQVIEQEVDPQDRTPTTSATVEGATVKVVSGVSQRKKKLASLLFDEGQAMKWQDRDRLYSLLLSNHSVFALDTDERGETSMVQMEITMSDAAPKKQPARRTPFAVRGEVARQLREMQENGVISPSSSPWASPVVLVRKKDGSLRFCIDYRELNSLTKADTFPLPRIDDLLDQLDKAKYFSTLDLASGFWQVRVHPNSIEKTAFITHQGLYQFNVMPFGLRNAPAVFQRLMQCVLAGLNPEDGPPFVSVYIDDILVFSQTFDDHLRHLGAVIDRVAKAGLKLKPSKCKFLRQSVEYLGHVLTPMGIRPNPERVRAMQQFPRPTTVKEVRQFLGLASYYRRFVKGFASIAQPLHALTKANCRYVWTTECQVAFDALKARMLMSPVLAFPNFSLSFILETDASVKGLGAVLSQRGEEDKKVHPVAYASRALSPTEQRYSVTELETLAVVWAVKHFHAYLYGHDVVVYTDHTAVKAVLTNPQASGKHARWWSHVYCSGIRNLEIVYRAGRENSNADALSRAPVTQSTSDIELVTGMQVATVHGMECEDLLQLDPDYSPSTDSDLSTQQAADPECRVLLDFLQRGMLPEDPVEARKVAAQATQFDVVQGVLCFLGPKGDGRARRVVPQALRDSLIDGYHSSAMSGHFSAPKVVKAIARYWWWPGMHKEVTEHCGSCIQCTSVNASGRVYQPLLTPIPVQRAFQIMGVDVMELPKTRNGNRYVAVFQDFLTKWPFVFPMPDQKAIRLVRLLVEEVIPITGVPECLLSDRGTNLLSHLMTDVCTLLGVKKLNTTSYHPACDGLVERFNRTLKTALRKRAAECGDQWDRYLSGVVWAYRNVPHESTGEKPSFLLFGVDLRSPTEAALLPSTQLTLTDIEDYREELVYSLSTARQLAADSIKVAQKKYKKYHDRHAAPHHYRVGEWVFVRFPQEETGRMRKLSRPWHGPYRIVSVQDPDVCVTKVYFPEEGQIRVHQSRVKPSPRAFPAGSYIYKGKKSQGRVPAWVERFLDDSGPLQPTADQGENPRPDLFSADSRVNDIPPLGLVDLFEETDANGSPGTDVSGSGGEEESVDPQVSPNADPVSLSDTLLSHGLDQDVFSENSENEDSGPLPSLPNRPHRQDSRYKLRSSVRPPDRLYLVGQPGGLASLGRGVM